MYFFIDIVKMFSRAAVPIYTPSPAKSESAFCPAVASTTVDYYVLFNFANQVGENLYFSMVLTCISLITSNTEEFFICLRIVCISLLKSSLYFAPFSISLFFFLLSLYI